MSKIIQRGRLIAVGLTVFASGFGMLALPNHAFSISNQSVIQLTNAQRAASGLPTLAWNAKLGNSAWLKAKDMCAKDYWAHTAPDGATGWTFMTRSGYNYTTAGENLAKGFSDDSTVVAGWMASPGHRANILNAAYAEIGVASETCTLQGISTTLVVAHYGASRSAPATTVTAKPAVRKATPSKPVQTVSTNVKAATTTPADAPVATPEPQITIKVKLAESFGSKIWSILWQHNLAVGLFQ